MDLSRIPNPGELEAVLKADGAPPYIVLDLTSSDLDGDGMVFIGLDDEGHLTEVEP